MATSIPRRNVPSDDRRLILGHYASGSFLHALDSVPTVRRLVAFYVQEHNTVLPHSAFRGQTPDEIYFGSGDAVPAGLTARAAAARQARVETNRTVSCGKCPLVNAAA